MDIISKIVLPRTIARLTVLTVAIYGDLFRQP